MCRRLEFVSGIRFALLILRMRSGRWRRSSLSIDPFFGNFFYIEEVNQMV
jgi:hypothetical protein